MSRIINAPEGIEKAMFTASLSSHMRVIEETEDKLGIKSKHERKEADVPDEVKEGTDEVQVGAPQVFQLLKIYEIENIKIPADIQIMSDKYDFFLVELACSFVPEKKSEFINVKFKIDLDFINGKDSSGDRENPIAYDMYPVEVFEEVQVTKTVGLNPILKFQELEVGGGNFLKEIKFTRLIPIIAGTGILCPSLAWSFDKTENRKLEGCRVMYLVIKSPKTDATIVGKIKLFGQIRRANFFFYYSDPVEYTVDLEKGILIHPHTR